MSRHLFPTSPRTAAWSVFALSLVTVWTACGARQSRNPFDGTTAGGVEDQIRVEVQNLNFNDVAVFAMRGGQRIRVGRVTGKTEESFTINWNVAQTIAFQIDVVGGRSCRTAEVGVDADSRVWVTIPSDMGFGVCRVGRR